MGKRSGCCPQQWQGQRETHTYLLPCAQLYCSALTQFGTHSTAHSGHDPPISIKNKDNPQTCPSTNLIWVVPQERLPSQVTRDCTKLAVNAN